MSHLSLDKVIPEQIIVYRILPYVQDRVGLANFASVSRKLHNLVVCLECAEFWDKASEKPFQICIDGYCSVCHLSQPRSSLPSAFRLLSKFPLRRILIHCFLTDIPQCLDALAERGVVTGLDISFTNKSNSPPLDVVLQDCHADTLTPYAFTHLRTLSLNSSHLYHVKLPGRARLLEILGSNLTKLEFLNLSPSKVFNIISNRCPQLLQLRVDKAQTLADLASYHSSQLLELELCRCMFIPSVLDFPSLRRLKFSAAFRMEDSQVRSVVACIPIQLTELVMEIPSMCADLLLMHISKSLVSLQTLILESSYEEGCISVGALTELGKRCVLLHTFEIYASKSVSRLGFSDANAFLVLGCGFVGLKQVELPLHCVLDVLGNFEELLSMSTCPPQIIIKAKRKWISGLWETLLKQFAALNKKFEQRHITLVDF
ncbi:hypothetical protein EON65_30970 [archaeon]|nr:MAG: hypothetical protein EON65_30970 [archaeon]